MPAHLTRYQGEAMGSTVERGYGYQHKKLRAQWKVKVEAGEVDCARCGHPIEPGTPWDLDHNEDRTAYLGPSHRACNRATLTHAKQAAAPADLTYEWF
jgi:hypothetical protein